jgi:hypothetical protein
LIKTFDLKSGDSYGLLREAAKSLLKKPFQINYELEGVKRTQEHVLLKQIDYMDSGQGQAESHEYIDVVVNNDMKPLLLQLQKNFTAYDLRNVTKLGVYAVRMYELLKQYETIGTRTLTIDEMKKMFQVEEQYKLNADFYRWVVKPAETEINRHTDITIFDVEKLKDGRKITTLRFKFRKKTEAELEKMRGKSIHDTLMVVQDTDYEDVTETAMPLPEPLAVLNTLTPFMDENVDSPHFNVVNERVGDGHAQEKLIVELLPIVVTKFGVSLKMFMSLVESYSEEDIRKAMAITDKMFLTGKIENIAGFFIEALRGHYQDADEQKKKIEADKIAQKKAQMQAVLKLEQVATDKKKLDAKARFEKQKAIFEQLIEDDDTFWLELEEKVKADNLIKNHYDFDKDIFENMQQPMISGALMAIAVKLRGDAFNLLKG